ncbi:uncharacterized protein PG998_007518 [Apiospora kogelbergensis]|uniref:uncharacterized protein n=1 Tax=Apiospora kogelbergensis TaxID=1337665 RepID=UPI00312F0E71
MPGEPPFIRIPPQQQHGPPPGQRPMPPIPPMLPMPPPPPPPEAIPVELRFNRPRVEVTDVSESFMTPAEMAAKCTEYAAFRFEKCSSNSRSSNNNDYYSRQALDRDEDYTTKSSWGQAVRTAIHDQPQQELAREVRRLNMQTNHVVAKKKDLGPVLQRQLDRTIGDLTASEHDPANFQWTLAQIDHQLRQVGPGNTVFCTSEPLVTRSHKHKSEGKKAHKTTNKTHAPDTKVKGSQFEGILRDLRDLRDLQDNNGPPGPPPPPPHVIGGGRLAAKVVQKNDNKKSKPYIEGESGSESSSSASDSGSELGEEWSGDESTLTDPTSITDTSSQSGRHGKRGRSHKRNHNHNKGRSKSHGKGRGKSQVKGRIASQSRSRMRRPSLSRHRHFPHEGRSAFGIPHYSPRMHQRHGSIYHLNSDPVFVPPLPRPPPPPPAAPIIVQPSQTIEIERIRDEAYINGRKDEKDKNRVLDELSTDHGPPRPLSRTRAGVRYVERRQPRRETRREPRGRVPRRPPYPEDDMETGDSYSSTEDEAQEYEPEYCRTETHHRSGRRGGAGYHRSSRAFAPRTPPLPLLLPLAAPMGMSIFTTPITGPTTAGAANRIPKAAVSSTPRSTPCMDIMSTGRAIACRITKSHRGMRILSSRAVSRASNRATDPTTTDEVSQPRTQVNTVLNG